MQADIVIIGAGIAGVSAAYFLSAHRQFKRIILVDELPPLTLTSDKSSECYRNWWPDESILALMNRSLDLLENLALKTNNRFSMNRRGYLYVTRQPERVPMLLAESQRISELGAGPLRNHDGTSALSYSTAPVEGFSNSTSGADFLTHRAQIQENFPYLSPDVQAVLHVCRAGWFSAQQLGMLLLELALQNGIIRMLGKAINLTTRNSRIDTVHLAGGEKIHTACVVLASGPYLQHLASFLPTTLPVFNELHFKAVINDTHRILPRHAPLVINLDAQFLPWDADERILLDADPSTSFLVTELPSGAHTRPEGGLDSTRLLLLWDYHTQVLKPVFPVPGNDFYPELALRGLAGIIPGLARYIGRSGRPVVDGGYYTRTIENRPIIGSLPITGVYISGAYSGYGLMASLAAGELLTAHITGSELPDYAQSFSLARYQDPAYQQRLTHWGDIGQL